MTGQIVRTNKDWIEDLISYTESHAKPGSSAWPMRSSRLLLTLMVSAIGVATPMLAAHSYEIVTVTDGGKIKGKVIFQGSPPRPKKIIPTKDREACGGVREKSPIVLAPDKGVQNAIVYLKKVDRGGAWGKTAKTAILDNRNCEFTPYMQVVSTGSDLEVINSDPVLHTVHGFVDKNTAFNMAMMKKTRRNGTTLKEAGMMRVECDSHGWMRAWIYVADNPYYVMTSKDGTFSLDGVPPGSYSLVAWHEYTGAVEIPVTLGAKGIVQLTAQLQK